MSSNLLRKIQSKGSHRDVALYEFKQLYLEHCDFVRASVFHMAQSESVCDDIVQDSFIKAWKNFERFEGNSSFKTWIYRISMNVTLDYLRKEKRRNELHVDEKINEHEDQVALKEVISKGMMKLSEGHRQAFSLFYYFGYTSCEISKLMEIPEGTVKSRVHKAKKEFIAFLRENGVTS